jgi:hypothetical protein
MALAIGLEMKASEMVMEIEQHTENKWSKGEFQRFRAATEILLYVPN